MALHIEPYEKTVQGLEIPRDASTAASSPEPNAELTQEMGAFQAYKVGLPNSNTKQSSTDQTCPEDLPVWAKHRLCASEHCSCGSHCFRCRYFHADIDIWKLYHDHERLYGWRVLCFWLP